MAFELNEQKLWELWQFAVFNKKAMTDVHALVAAIEKNKKPIYQIDFCEIHPYLFPFRFEGDLLRNDLPLINHAVRHLWESLLEMDMSSLPFSLVINLPTRLEILECFWHVERRILTSFARYISPELEEIIKMKSSDLQDNKEEVLKRLVNSDYKTFVPQLRVLISEKVVQEPIQRLLRLLDHEILVLIEESISKVVLEDALEHGPPPDVREMAQRFLQGRTLLPTKAWMSKHRAFHIDVDSLSLCLAYYFRHSIRAKDYFAPLLTHAFPLIAAGRYIHKGAKDPLVHHSIAPFYLAQALRVETMKEMGSFFDLGLNLVGAVVNELGSHSTIKKLSQSNGMPRQEQLAQKNYTVISDRLIERVQFFISQYYGLVDTSTLLPLRDKAVDGTVQTDNKQIKVSEFGELVSNKGQAVTEIRKGTKNIREKLGSLEGLYAPHDAHAKVVTDWLGEF